MHYKMFTKDWINKTKGKRQTYCTISKNCPKIVK